MDRNEAARNNMRPPQVKQELPVEQQYKEKTITWNDDGVERKRKVIEVPIKWEGETKIVEIRKLTWGERAEFTDKFLKIEIIGEVPRTNILMREMQVQTLVIGLHSAPFPTDEAYIVKELDGEMGEFLYQIVDKYNKLNPATRKKSSEQPKTE